MSQFGGSPRDQEYGFFTTPAPTAVTTSQFGSTAVQTKPTAPPTIPADGVERPAPAFGLPAPTHRATPDRSRSRLALPLVLLLLVALTAGGALAYRNGLIPGLDQPVAEGLDSSTPSAYVVAAPEQLLGWQRSNGPQAQKIDARFLGSGALPDNDVTTFLYVEGNDRPAMYGAVIVQQLSKSEQRAYLSGVARGMRRAAPDGTVGAFTDRPAGALGGFFRCATLQTKPAGTTCVFTDAETSGVLVLLDQRGKHAIDDARAAREALITPR